MRRGVWPPITTLLRACACAEASGHPLLLYYVYAHSPSTPRLVPMPGAVTRPRHAADVQRQGGRGGAVAAAAQRLCWPIRRSRSDSACDPGPGCCCCGCCGCAAMLKKRARLLESDAAGPPAPPPAPGTAPPGRGAPGPVPAPPIPIPALRRLMLCSRLAFCRRATLAEARLFAGWGPPCAPGPAGRAGSAADAESAC